jgi:LysM repeat protein
MFHVVELRCAPRLPHVAVLALISIGFAGCSADMSTRVSENPFSNPFASQPEATASVPSAPVERRELPQYARPQSQSSAPAVAAPQSFPTAGTGPSGGGRGVTSYAPPGQPLETTGSAAPRSVAATRGSGQGGTTIIVGTSDTLDTLSRRYSVSPAAILQANGYKGPRALSPGQQLIIPHPTAAVAAPAVAAPASKAVASSAAPSVHVVNNGDTLLSIAHRNHVPVAEMATQNLFQLRTERIVRRVCDVGSCHHTGLSRRCRTKAKSLPMPRARAR